MQRILKLSYCILIICALDSCWPPRGRLAQNPSRQVIDDSGEGYVISLSRREYAFGPNYFRRIATALEKHGGNRYKYTPVMIDKDLVSLLVERPQGKDEFVQKLFSGIHIQEVNSLNEALEFMRTQTKYRRDRIVFGRKDVWQSSEEMANRRIGDCEDHAILLADILIGLGIEVRVVFGGYRQGEHVWIVVLQEDGTTKLIESTSKDSKGFMNLSQPTEIPEYYPYLVFDNTFLYKLRPDGNPRDMLDWERSGEYVPR